MHVNQTHSLIAFVESLSDVKYASKIPKEIYLADYKNDEEFINKLKAIHKKLNKKAIYKHKKTKSLLEAIYIESLKSKNLNQLKTKIFAYKTSMKKNELEKYFHYLNQLLPKYEKSIWVKEYDKLISKKNEIMQLMNKHNYDRLIQKVAHFYHVDSEKMDKIDIAFYPIPSGDNVNAYRIKNLETVGVLVNKNQNLQWLLSATILHEISHTIYSKSQIVKQNFNIKNRHKRSNIVESMATSIGAGWGYEQISGKLATIKWYNNKTYDKLAKIIYPTLKIYLDNDKKLDKNLIKYVKELL